MQRGVRNCWANCLRTRPSRSKLTLGLALRSVVRAARRARWIRNKDDAFYWVESSFDSVRLTAAVMCAAAIVFSRGEKEGIRTSVSVVQQIASRLAFKSLELSWGAMYREADTRSTMTGRKFAGVDHRERRCLLCARVHYEEKKRWENKRVPPG